jgi:hypothetical protein
MLGAKEVIFISEHNSREEANQIPIEKRRGAVVIMNAADQLVIDEPKPAIIITAAGSEENAGPTQKTLTQEGYSLQTISSLASSDKKPLVGFVANLDWAMNIQEAVEIVLTHPAEEQPERMLKQRQ